MEQDCFSYKLFSFPCKPGCVKNWGTDLPVGLYRRVQAMGRGKWLSPRGELLVMIHWDVLEMVLFLWNAAFPERRIFMRRSRWSPWRWYRSQRRKLQFVIGGSIILLVLLICIFGGVTLARGQGTAQHSPASGATPTDTPTLPALGPTTIPVTPLPTIIAMPVSSPTITPTATSTGTPSPTPSASATAHPRSTATP